MLGSKQLSQIAHPKALISDRRIKLQLPESVMLRATYEKTNSPAYFLGFSPREFLFQRS